MLYLKVMMSAVVIIVLAAVNSEPIASVPNLAEAELLNESNSHELSIEINGRLVNLFGENVRAGEMVSPMYEIFDPFKSLIIKKEAAKTAQICC